MNEQLAQIPTQPSGTTPLMAQYLAIKAEHAEYLLFYRMGDFYELFFDDAVTAAAALDIALTKRGKHCDQDIQMCGVPVHAADSYLEKLIRKGFRVAVCEQIEDPAEAKKRGAKSVVRREVIRLVTPGTLTEDTLLEPRTANILAALSRIGGVFALASADISSGEFCVGIVNQHDLATELARVSPRELLVPDLLLADPALAPLLKSFGSALSPIPQPKFDSAQGERALRAHYAIANLDGFGEFARAEIAAAGALIGYLELTQKGHVPALTPPTRLMPSHFMGIDAATRRNLELVKTLLGDRRGSLLSVIDRTVTSAGGRELATRLSAPLMSVAEIAQRQNAIGFFLGNDTLRHALREDLGQAPDIARALARLSVGRGGPRDLGAVRNGAAIALRISERLKLDDPLAPDPGELKRACFALKKTASSLAGLLQKLEALLVIEPPHLARDGGFIKDGAHPELDDLRQLRDESRRVIVGLETRYRHESSVSQLRIKHNGVLGYFIEVTPQHAERLQQGDNRALFHHRQTIGSAVRFSTDELATLATRISHAADQALVLEKTLFDDLTRDVLGEIEALNEVANALGTIDVAAGLSELAAAKEYARPLVDDSTAFEIVRGRHPVVEDALNADHAQPFVPNDCDLSAGASGRFWLVTGPNMAGKSTFLRQNAVIAILAQMGSYVPAASAHIGIIDRLFSRVGAGDDLAAGRSTFMVEMVETAAILNQATSRSLVILDEIGRGTATFDGLAIAWAAAEHLHDTNKSRALFATHYHEMTALSERLALFFCVTMQVREWNDSIVFMHEVTPGAADRSYGIHVAKLAGLPPSVIGRAQRVLKALEEGREGHQPLAQINDLPLFATGAKPDQGLHHALSAIDPDMLTPRQALDALYALKARI